MEIIREIGFQVIQILTLIFGVLGMTFSAMLVFAPNLTRGLSDILNRNVDVDKKIGLLDKNIEISEFFYRNHVKVGSLIIAGSFFILFFFYFSLDMAKFTKLFFDSPRQAFWGEIVVAASLWVGKFTCLAGVFEQTTYVRGMQDFFMDIAADKKYFEALMDRVLESFIEIYTRYFEVVGPHLDVVQFWGDLGTQRGPLIAPDVYRKYIKPREMELVKLTKKMTNAKVALHTCGAIIEFIPDLILAGYDILNPVQTTAEGMDPVRLKKDFGDDIVFWGSIDTQNILPFGNVEQVKDEVKRKIDTLAPGGGYLLAPCHNIQAQTPPENVKAMFETALEYGVY